jgi:hypothetical protein
MQCKIAQNINYVNKNNPKKGHEKTAAWRGGAAVLFS